MLVGALVKISIREKFFSLTVLETFVEFPLVAIPVDPHVLATTVGLALYPFTLVRVTLVSQPAAKTVLQAILPHTHVLLAVRPEETSLAMGLALSVLPIVKGPLWEDFDTCSVLLVCDKFAFVGTAIFVKQ
jgi:hypothetical protein